MHMDPELRKNQSAEVPLGRESNGTTTHGRQCAHEKLTLDGGFAARAGFSKPWEQAGQVVYFLSKYSSCKSWPPFSSVCLCVKRERELMITGVVRDFAGEQTRPVRALTSTA